MEILVILVPGLTEPGREIVVPSASRELENPSSEPLAHPAHGERGALSQLVTAPALAEDHASLKTINAPIGDGGATAAVASTAAVKDIVNVDLFHLGKVDVTVSDAVPVGLRRRYRDVAPDHLPVRVSQEAVALQEVQLHASGWAGEGDR